GLRCRGGLRLRRGRRLRCRRGLRLRRRLWLRLRRRLRLRRGGGSRRRGRLRGRPCSEGLVARAVSARRDRHHRGRHGSCHCGWTATAHLSPLPHARSAETEARDPCRSLRALRRQRRHRGLRRDAGRRGV
ncbi:MAG: hypothetical protein AVDCRST_MAG30-3002, partial [uncultured Solirubrobacteraceae bacterium]